MIAWCTAETIALLLGVAVVPAPGSTVMVPRSLVAQYSEKTNREVRQCAKDFRLKLKIDESK